MREYLSILQPMIAGEAVRFEGAVLRTTGRLTIADAHRVPVLLAAMGPRMLQLAGTMTDGTLLGWAGPKTVRDDAAPGDDGKVRIWDTASGTTTATLTGHDGGVRSVAWSPDGTRLASGSADATVRIWDTASGTTTTATLSGHDGGVLAVASSLDGTRLASCSDDATVRIWDAASGTTTATLTGHDGGVLAVAWSPDGTRLASGSDDGTVQVADAADDHTPSVSGRR